VSVAAEQLQRAVELVRKYVDTPRRDIAIAHLRDVVEAVKREAESRKEQQIMTDTERLAGHVIVDVEDGYRPPTREAWCTRCDDVRPCDDGGCLSCRGAR
jgi:hypothetical protein